jgi:hypothetical protein
MARLAPLVAALIVLVPVGAARAGDAYTGVHGDDESQFFAYLGVQEDLPWQVAELQLFGHLFGAAQRYEYETGGRGVDADVQFVTPSLGVRRGLGDSGWTAAAFAGPKLQWKREDAPFIDSDRDLDIGVFVQAEAMYWEEARSLHVFGNFSGIDAFFFGRLRGKQRIHDAGERCCNLFAGADVSRMGNEDYDAVQVGPLLEVQLGRVFLLVRGGYQRDSSFDDLAYGGVELYTPF